MKKLFLSIFLALPTMLMAQGSWVAPTTTAKQTTTHEVKEQAIDSRYLKGAVPEVDGLVVYNFGIDMPGMTVDQVYDRVYAALEEMVNEENQVKGKSNIAIVNKQQHSIGAHFVENMVFQNTLLVLDQTYFNYTLLAECYAGKATFRISRLTYDYPHQDLVIHYSAEELITDKHCLSKDGQKLKRRDKKFRMNTIDRMAEIESNLKELVGVKG